MSALTFDRYDEYKDSGNGWLGEIPKSWSVLLNKRLLKKLTDFTANGSFADLAKNVSYLDEGYARLIRLTDLRKNLTNGGLYVDKDAYNFLEKTKLYGEEILVANVGAYTGLAMLVPKLNTPATLGPNMFLVDYKDMINSVYILLFLKSEVIKLDKIAVENITLKVDVTIKATVNNFFKLIVFFIFILHYVH
jgi:type I restriction enzyme S subunit